MTWKDIPGYEGCYQVSDTGEVRSLPRKADTKAGWIQSIQGGTLKQKTDRYGYKCVRLCKGSKIKDFTVHALVLMAFDRDKEEGEACRHLDGNPENNNRSNLKWGTGKENQQDSIKHGTHSMLNKRGSQTPNAKLSNSKAFTIRYLYHIAKYSRRKLAEIYNVSICCIDNVINRKTWKHI